MTKPLTKQEKKERKEARKQQKAKSPTVKTVTQPKPEDQPTETPSPPVNLCDDCAYEFGECEGKPKFGKEGALDNVIECPAFINVEKMPTAQEAAATTPFAEALKRLDKSGQALLNDRSVKIIHEADRRFGPEVAVTQDEMADILVQIVQEIIQNEGNGSPNITTQEDELEKVQDKAEEEDDARRAAEEAEEEAELEARQMKTQRFFREEDFGPCQSCNRPLKRTALNRDLDAVRCVNGRCRQYRFIIRTIPTGVK